MKSKLSRTLSAALTVAVVLSIVLAGAAEAQVLKREPPPGGLRSGERVLVDDGKCPRGQIKEVIGGRNSSGGTNGPPRTRRCIPR